MLPSVLLSKPRPQSLLPFVLEASFQLLNFSLLFLESVILMETIRTGTALADAGGAESLKERAAP